MMCYCFADGVVVLGFGVDVVCVFGFDVVFGFWYGRLLVIVRGVAVVGYQLFLFV